MSVFELVEMYIQKVAWERIFCYEPKPLIREDPRLLYDPFFKVHQTDLAQASNLNHYPKK